MSQRQLLVRNGVLVACTFCALVLLASFYSIVSEAVVRGASHRPATSDARTVSSATGSIRTTARPSVLLAHSDD